MTHTGYETLGVTTIGFLGTITVESFNSYVGALTGIITLVYVSFKLVKEIRRTTENTKNKGIDI